MEDSDSDDEVKNKKSKGANLFKIDEYESVESKQEIISTESEYYFK